MTAHPPKKTFAQIANERPQYAIFEAVTEVVKAPDGSLAVKLDTPILKSGWPRSAPSLSEYLASQYGTGSKMGITYTNGDQQIIIAAGAASGFESDYAEFQKKIQTMRTMSESH